MVLCRVQGRSEAFLPKQRADMPAQFPQMVWLDARTLLCFYVEGTPARRPLHVAARASHDAEAPRGRPQPVPRALGGG